MPFYDFKTLSPIDFEILVRDLLQEELQVTLESFAPGRDRGIDLRYCMTEDNGIIIQCKHYSGSSFNDLYSHLQKDEAVKVKQLSPIRYIFVTSLSLTPGQKSKILSVFSPFILSSADIYGNQDLNNLLGKFPKVETNSFKLWISSVPVLERVLHSGVLNMSMNIIERIRENTKRYVQNKSFSEAKNILQEHNFCIIAGIPGIGKTTLAEMLLLTFCEAGYEPIVIREDISEATNLGYTNRRRLFYYDDFLGQTSLSEKLNKNEDQKLLDFIHTIRQSKVSKLILTTREYILNQARMIYEKLDRTKFDIETCVIDLEKYTRRDRSKILFNHIYFSDLTNEHKAALLNNRNYLRIIDHPNYNPRIIELMTQHSNLARISSKGYFEFFMSNLDNPLEIWRHAFEKQLSDDARSLLLVMASMPGEIFITDLEEAFEKFHRLRVETFGIRRSTMDFRNALKETDGNFIKTYKDGADTIVLFHNPSVKDFIKHHINEHKEILYSLFRCAEFIDQIMILWDYHQNENPSSLSLDINENANIVVNTIKMTIKNKSCRLINFHSGDGKIEKRRWDISFEERLKFAIIVARELASKDLAVFVLQSIEEVEKRISQKLIDRAQLTSLLEDLMMENLLPEDRRSKFFKSAKDFIVEKPDWLSEFEAVYKLFKSFPNLISEEDIAMVRDNIIHVATDDYDADDPDVIRDDIMRMKELEQMFEIDLSRQIAKYEEWAEELESEQLMEQDIEGGFGGSSGNEYCTDFEIESMFNTLKL